MSTLAWLFIYTLVITAVVAITAGIAYERGRKSVPDTSASYWQGFAEGEAHGREVMWSPCAN